MEGKQTFHPFGVGLLIVQGNAGKSFHNIVGHGKPTQSLVNVLLNDSLNKTSSSIFQYDSKLD